jgi:hypothetical protein
MVCLTYEDRFFTKIVLISSTIDKQMLINATSTYIVRADF